MNEKELDNYLKQICFAGSNPDVVIERVKDRFPGIETKGLFDTVMNFIEYENEKRF